MGEALGFAVGRRLMPFLICAVLSCASKTPGAVPARLDESLEQEIAGTFIENFQESIFFPCGIRMREDGWWARFAPHVQADRVHYQYDGPGFPTSTHDIRVIGRISPPGRFGTGFHTREIVISKLMEVKNPGGICATYEQKPPKWKGAGPVPVGVRSAVRSRDGSLVAILDWLGEFTIWSSLDGRIVQHFSSEQTFRRDDGNSLLLAMSPLGELLAAGGADGIVRVWRVRDGLLLHRLSISVGKDTIRDSLAKVSGGIRVIRGNTFPVTSIAFSPGGTRLVTAGGFRAYVWSMTTGRVIDTLALGPERSAGSPDRTVVLDAPTRIITSGPGNTLRVYGAEGGEPLFSASVPGGSEILAISPDNKWVAIKGASDSVLLWSLPDGAVKHRLGVPHFFWGTLSFSPDSRSIAIGGGAFAVYVWDTETGSPLASIHGLYHVPRSLWFTKNSDSIVVSAAFDSSLYAVPFRRRR
jgi:hypothetical protein